ncbi:glycosyltransferase [Rhizobium lemnae]|uniref:Glycosyltransferase n=1 Tax=Rhizobium lemnae TaxID=1214924 RepID=A0ABV8E7Z1_9HYPH|nr:glycosyltransferase [Rhizobium lemnae]MCJ8509876.1 glycosyltransferase [Rhizobium lemnae]
MKILILTIGTEGDVRPLVALGVGLRARGHDVRIATHSMFRAVVEQHGLEFANLDGDFREWMSANKLALGRALKITEMLSAFRKQLRHIAVNWPEQGLAAAEGVDLIIGNGMVSQLGLALGERLGIPCVETQLVASFPSYNPPPIPLPAAMYNLPGPINYGLGWLARISMIGVVQPAYDEHVRPRLGLRPMGRQSPYRTLKADHLRLVAVSPSLVQRHVAWPDNIKIVGDWSLRESELWQPPTRLQDFLSDGESPVYIGFGSMYHVGAVELTALLHNVLRALNRRGIIATGWGGLDKTIGHDAKHTIVIEHAPHDWLFERVAMAVHHGGAGTTHAVARAGLPSVVMPVFGDQPFWASCLRRRGVAPAPIPREKATFKKLLKAFETALSESMQAKAKDLRNEIQRQDGVGRAISVLEAHGLLW